MAINNIGINTQSFGVPRNNGVKNSPAQDDATQNITDGFQASGGAAPVEAGAKAEVTLTVTPSQLQSQAFQATMATLSASGVPVQVVLVAESTLAPPASKGSDPAAAMTDLGGVVPQAAPTQPRPAPQPTYTPPAPRHHTPSYGSD